MRLKLASRKSDLARWQAVVVGRALEQHSQRPRIEYLFKASLGDQNLDLPLAGMGAKGVFTEDFYQDLTQGLCDLVVHSWKDLPVEERSETQLVMTLPREDVRDILLVPKSVLTQARTNLELTVLTSSPRRVHNLWQFLPGLLPTGEWRIQFENVRGNVPTRIQKMFEQGKALVLAKAGLDRLLAAESAGFVQDLSLKAKLQECQFQILPVCLNPPAPAQGALAVEVARDNHELTQIMSELNHAATFKAVQKERAILKSYGGGCHQKIGVAVLPKDYGVVRALRGQTDGGETLEQWEIESDTPWSRAQSADHVFPREAKDNHWFTRHTRAQPNLEPYDILLVARFEAWPANFTPKEQQWIWTSGVQTWRRLAQAGHWVHGCFEGLGDQEAMRLEHWRPSFKLAKLTHGQSSGEHEVEATYDLKPRPATESPDLRGKTHFFWMSGTAFQRARELYPAEVARGQHACGAGQTLRFLQQQPDLAHPPKVFADLEQFLRATLP